MSSSKSEWIVKKRDRTQNWQPEEKRQLFELIKPKIHIIENKKIDAETTAAKNFAWQNICCSFKKKIATDRDPPRMREQWRRMKTQSQIDIRAFESKVKSVGLAEAKRSLPSNLSVEVWRLVQSVRQLDEILDDEAEDIASLHAILESIYPSNKVVEPLLENFKAEYVTLDNNPCADDEDMLNNFNQEEKSDEEEEELEIEPVERKRKKLSHNDEQRKNSLIEEREQFLLEAAQEEHTLKMKILAIELERAELQKQTAQNDLKTSEINKKLVNNQASDYSSQARMVGERGSGAGKGGGGGGSIREAGGAFGKMEAAQEDQYFYNQQKEQLKHLREGLHDEISFHEEQIKRHQEAINRHKERIGNMENK